MDDKARDAMGELLEEGLADEAAHALRLRMASDVPARLAENGLRLSLHHQLGGDSAGLAFATATEMAAELGDGSAQLFRLELWYPGAALVRQLLECGYLLALASEQRDEAEDWFESSREDILARFMPRHMRDRSARTFRVSEYQTHCDWGGHPNPAGRGLLRGHEEWRPVSPRWLWLDLGQHLSEIWETFTTALPLYDPRMDPSSPLHSPDRSPDGGGEIAALLAEWREHDPLAERINMPLNS